MMPPPIAVDSTLTVNELVARYPQTMAVFNRFGIDTCCGGGVALNEAVYRDGLDLTAVMTALHEAIERPA
jgi:iron-sulfur cluster repair protein YtfE (RIC family)